MYVCVKGVQELAKNATLMAFMRISTDEGPQSRNSGTGFETRGTTRLP